jgi:hypothetical protein
MSQARQTELLEIGHQGSTLIKNTSLYEGSWRKVVPYETTVFDTLTDASREGGAIGAESFPANFEITGQITAIKLASGAVVAYK